MTTQNLQAVLLAGLAFALLAGCSGVPVISPNDPAYYDSGAPRTLIEPRYAPGQRPYKPLGGQSVV